MASFVEKSKKNKKKGEMFFSIALAYSCPNIVSFIGILYIIYVLFSWCNDLSKQVH